MATQSKKRVARLLPNTIVLSSRGQPHDKTFTKVEVICFAVAALVLTLLWIPTLFARESTVIQNQRYWFLADDAMISMRYAENLAEGWGLVWNPGERVEGYSNFLWVVYMAFVHLLGISKPYISLIILLTNLLLAIGTMPALIHLVKLLGGSTLVAALVLAGLLVDKSIMVWATGGFEVMLLTCLFTWSLYRILHEAHQADPKVLTWLLVGVMGLVRADAFVLMGLLYLIALALTPRRATLISLIGLSLVLPLLHLAFRLSYYGELLPNTAYLKTYNFNGRIEVGLNYVWLFIKSYWILFGFALAGVVAAKKQVQYWLLLLIAIDMVYVGYAGGDAFPYNRFFTPVIPLLLVIGFCGVGTLLQRQLPLLLGVGIISLCLIPGYVLDYPYFLKPHPQATDNVHLSMFLQQNTPANSKIASTWAGSLFYFSERYGIDLLGKMDAHIAHLPFTIGTQPGHNKFDLEYSIGTLQPDYVVANFKWPEVVEQQKALEATVQNNAPPYVKALLFSPSFRRYCLPYPLQANTWVTVYHCKWKE